VTWVGRMKRELLTDTVREAERTRRLNAPADVLDRRALAVFTTHAVIDLAEVLRREDLEARDDALAGQVVDALDRPRLGDLHLQRALAEAEAQHLRDVLLHLRLKDDVVPGDAEVDVALAHERRDVRRGEEDATRGM
jgi:hypothetical protein